MFSPFSEVAASADQQGLVGADRVAKDKDPRLYYACSEGNWEEAERLIEDGVGLNFCKVCLHLCLS